MSRNRVNIIVQGQYLDLYEDTRIVLNQKIQDVKDISKVFTDYTEEITIPASQNNNKVFKHAFRKDSDDFDTRGFYTSVVELNGEEYNRGYVELISSEFKSGKTYSYKIRHYGNLLTLSRIIGDRKFTDINGVFSQYNFPQDSRAFYDLLTTAEDTLLPNIGEDYWEGYDGQAVSDNVRVFLNNDTENRFLFDSRASFDEGDIQEGDKNVAYTAWTTGTPDPDETFNGAQGVEYNGIVLERMKASLKETAFLDGIERGFPSEGLQFSRGLDSKGNPTSKKNEVVTGDEHFFGSEEYENSWILFYNKDVGGATQERQLFFEDDWDTGDLPDRPFGLERYCDFSINGYGNVYPPLAPYYKNKRNFSDYYLELDLTTSDDTVEWTLEFHTNGTVTEFTQKGPLKQTQDRTLTTPDVFPFKGNSIVVVGKKVLNGADFPYSSVTCLTGEFIVKSEEPLTITGVVNLNKVWLRDFYLTTRYEQFALTNSIDDISTDAANYTLNSNTPNIQIMDYFTGLNKTYNLMYYVDRDSNGNKIIVAQTADNYYDGEVINLTQATDTQEYEAYKPKYYTEIDFSYDKSGTFLTEEFDNQYDSNYGDLRSEVRFDNDFLVPSREYKVENPFEMILLNATTNTNPDIEDDSVIFTYPWLVDNGYAATEIGAFRHYGSLRNTSQSTNGLLFKSQGQVAAAEVTECNLSSSYRYEEDILVSSLLYSTNSPDPYLADGTGASASDPSLYNLYWNNTIVDLFDRFAKLHKFKARLSRRDLASLRLSQNVLISDNTYRINGISVNLMTGDANLELISLNQPDIIGAYRDSYRGGFLFNTITINSFTADPGFNIFVGDEVTVTVDASGGASGLSYAWYINDTLVSGETENSISLNGEDQPAIVDDDTIYCEVSDGSYDVDTLEQTFSTTAAALALTSIVPDKTTVDPDGDTIVLTLNGGAGTPYTVNIVSVVATDYIVPSDLDKTTGVIGSDGTDTVTVTVPAYTEGAVPQFQFMEVNMNVPSNTFTTPVISQVVDDTLVNIDDDFIITEIEEDQITINR